jgi:hypothetical protein
MQLFINKKIGKRAYNFVVDGADLHEAVMESEHLSFPDVPFCGLCNSDNLRLTARVAQGFKYVSIKCEGCRGDLTFGKTKADANTYFLRRDDSGRFDWKAYNPDTV